MNPVATHTSTNSLATIASELASRIQQRTPPRSPQIHLVPTAGNTQLFVANGSRMYTVSDTIADRFQQLLATGDEAAITTELIALGLDTPVLINDTPLESPKLYALSLAIAQKCNMGCAYCYADQGDFGGPTKNMSLDTAKQSVDLLLKDCTPGSKVQVTFLGGEPLINRNALREATAYAFEQGRQKGIQVNFSLTSNGTLLRADDAGFFEQYGFAVTISLDGIGEQHDRLRPMKGGAGTYAKIIENIQPLLALQRKMQVSARVTVTPLNMDIAKTLQEFVDMGFHSVGFSPLLRSSNGKGEMSPEDLQQMLQGMIECGLLLNNMLSPANAFRS
ncbi:radical SAM protein [Chitinophaga pinensis]|uniref:radical SAM protein n=1 Tax=Chitinophaga pinensis TaxID=79329 RepID=UPI001C99E5CE|nr:radical SAM protein [Chitinophaga pinensis]